MPTGAVKRTRGPGASRNSVRAKESAELARVCAAQAALPPLSALSLPIRPNRRQRAAANSTERKDQSTEPPSADELVFRNFSDMPLSTRTLDGLAASQFAQVTDVQRRAIPQALAGRDVLAAAPTGSGKTLAFIVPLLESLWRAKWSTYDGLGALVLAPTRELALQIFEVFRSVAKFHMLSAGLVIGGKDFEFEKSKIGSMNVLVATPGRLLHHMDHVAELDCSSLRVLVLDEADRILDLGFSRTLDAILENVPNEGRQTLLFSATQTKSVRALARLSLRSPQYVTVTAIPGRQADGSGLGDKSGVEAGEYNGDANEDVDPSGVNIVGVPKGLYQSYAVVEPHEKVSVLWSFIKTHIKSKVIVFFATGKEVRFAFNAFCKLRPGISLLHIHGNMKQLKRTDMYDSFCRTQSAVLFATDVASRGLDFPDVEWVVQFDCPDDVSSYVHRVGRTARFRSNGRSMLLLNRGHEELFLERLKSRNLQLNRARINPARVTSITPRIAALVASNQEMKNLAQRALTFYLKSVHRQHDKEVFNAAEIDYRALAGSFGLSSTPVVRFKNEQHGQGVGRLGGLSAVRRDGEGKNVFGYRPLAEEGGGGERSGQRPGSRQTAEDIERLSQGEADNEDEVLVVKRVYDGHSLAEDDGDDGALEDRPAARKRKRIKLDILKNGPSANRIVFSDDGRAMRASEVAQTEESSSSSEDGDLRNEDSFGIDAYAASVAKRLAHTSDADKARELERVRAMRAKKKERLGGTRKQEGAEVELEPRQSSESDEGDGELDEALARIAARASAGGSSEDGSGSEGEHSEDDSGLEAEEAAALRILARRRHERSNAP